MKFVFIFYVTFCFQKGDRSLLAQFFYADDELNAVAAELDSFDGKKDPQRCTALVNHLRQCQDKVSKNVHFYPANPLRTPNLTHFYLRKQCFLLIKNKMHLHQNSGPNL